MRFTVPDRLLATEPPEARGLARDQVRLLVATPDAIHDSRFDRIGDHLREGDLLVVNDSRTVSAAVDGQRADGRGVTVHFATELDPVAAHRPPTWVVEVRPASNANGPVPDAEPGEIIRLPQGVRLTLLHARTVRLWEAAVEVEGAVAAWLELAGRPISYSYLNGRWPIADYQTVFARRPGSAEMPSAGRPFSTELVTELVSRGIRIAPITLHCGLSSPEAGEPPQPERFRVPDRTADLVEHTRSTGGRIVALGTTVTRALESSAGRDGRVGAAAGWTDLVLGPDRPARVVTGLVTGWHTPGASHLDLLQAVAGPELVGAAYRHALGAGYLWHEFGDSCLLLSD